MHLTGNEPDAARPTGLPADPLDAAQALAAHLGTRINVPTPGRVGILMHTGSMDQISAAAQVAQAAALADIAQSLRIIAGRGTDNA